ncbi:MAG: restriction endonuclease subunit S [Nitrospira sp.]|nr:restriction endonuclease subunit S [Nitrospira sp.]
MKNGWKTKSLGEVCSFLNRGISPRYLESGGICVLNQKCIRDHRVSYEPSRRHDARAKKVGSERLIQAGDVLVNSTGTGTLGRVAQLREAPLEPTTVDSHVTIVRPTPGKFYPEFFGYMLVVIEDAIKEAGEGCGGQTELARSALAEKFPVHYPESLFEQQRIVGILDEAFEGLATAKANAEKNLRNARALFESHLQSVFTQRGKGWENLQLVSVCDLFVDSAHRTPKYADDGIPALRPRDVVNGKLNLEGALRVCEEEYEIQSKRYKPKPGDIVYSRELSYGWAALLPRSPRVCLSQGMCLFRPSSKLDASFLLYVLNGSIGREQATRAAVGAAHPHINLGDIKSYLIPMPPLETQRQIAEQLNALREESQRLESIYQRKLAALDALKKSLLHQAFSGAL